MANHFRIVNPATLAVAAATVARAAQAQDCGVREDAPVCTSGGEDVECTGERYRGCETGQTDCANNPGNDDDVCCWGAGPGSGDNIDHEFCIQDDSGWGGIGWCILWDFGNPPY
ncbi:MAG TPA: hypothetical protein VGC93_19935 [Thermoanaerobaculia bacterium]